VPARYQSDGSRVRSCVPERESLLHHDDFRRCITKRCITKDEIGGGFGHGDRDIIVDSRWCRVQDFLYLEGIGLSVQNANPDLPLPHSAANVYHSILKFFSLAIGAALIFQVLHSIGATHNHGVAFG